MKYVENGVPEDFAKLTFTGLKVPLCELSPEEYDWIVFGRKTKATTEGEEQKLGTPKDTSELHSQSIDVLDLTVRAENCLRRAGIATVGQLCSYTEEELFRLRNMGIKTVKDIVVKLELSGCELKKE